MEQKRFCHHGTLLALADWWETPVFELIDSLGLRTRYVSSLFTSPIYCSKILVENLRLFTRNGGNRTGWCMAKRLMLTVWWFTIEDLPLLPFKSHHWKNLMGLSFGWLRCWTHFRIYFSNEMMNIFVLNTPFEDISFSDHSGQCISEFCFWFCGEWVYVDDLWSYKMSKCHLREFVRHFHDDRSGIFQ